MTRISASMGCLVAFVGVTAASLLGQPAAQAAQGTDVVSAAMAPGSQSDDSGAFFRLDLAPGASVGQSVVISNPNTKPVLVDISGVDAWTSTSTGASYGTPGSKPTGTGRWITVRDRQIQLAPREQRTVEFRVEVPSDAEPGQHLGAVSVSVPTQADQGATQRGADQAAFNVALQAQRVIAVQVDIAGDRSPNLLIGGARAVAHGDSIDVELAIANTGNAFARGRGVLMIPDTSFRFEFPIDTFVSKTSIKMLIPWTRTAPLGEHKVEAVLTYDDGKRATWSGVVSIDEALLDELDGQLTPIQPIESAASMIGLNAVTIGGGAAGMAACSALALRLRRRRNLLANGVRVRD